MARTDDYDSHDDPDSITPVAMALSNVHGAVMRLISDFEAVTFIAIVAVMAALALVVAVAA